MLQSLPTKCIYYRLSAQEFDNFAWFWEAAHFVFRKNLLAIYSDVEYAATANLEFDGYVKFLFEFLCQTGSRRLVVSSAAIKDVHVHRMSS